MYITQHRLPRRRRRVKAGVCGSTPCNRFAYIANFTFFLNMVYYKKLPIPY